MPFFACSFFANMHSTALWDAFAGLLFLTRCASRCWRRHFHLSSTIFFVLQYVAILLFRGFLRHGCAASLLNQVHCSLYYFFSLAFARRASYGGEGFLPFSEFGYQLILVHFSGILSGRRILITWSLSLVFRVYLEDYVLMITPHEILNNYVAK